MNTEVTVQDSLKHLLFEACENDSNMQKCHRAAILDAFLHRICEGTEQIHTENKCGLTSFGLKMIAIITMLCDHVAAVFSNYIPPDLYTAMRCIGRIAFPIFCFMLAEGFYYTKNRRKYASRLFLFCLLSEPCYDLAFHQVWYYQESQNVFWTLLFGLLMMALLETVRRYLNTDKVILKIAKGVLMTAVMFAFGYLAYRMKTDYSFKGILMIAAFYFLRKHRIAGVAAASLVNLAAFQRLTNLIMSLKVHSPVTFGFYFLIQDAGVLAGLPILLYNGQKGRSMKWFFYLFYPLHLLMLFMIRRSIFNI